MSFRFDDRNSSRLFDDLGRLGLELVAGRLLEGLNVVPGRLGYQRRLLFSLNSNFNRRFLSKLACNCRSFYFCNIMTHICSSVIYITF